MDIRHFRYFVAVADALSFGKAARNLYMSQPPLSKRIGDMEGELGVRLFDRSSKKVALTAAGQALLPQAKAAIEAFDSAMRVARAVSPTQSKRLRIASPPDTSRNVLLEVVNQLSRENVEVNLAMASTAEQQRLLGTGEVDVGLLRYPFHSHGLKVSPPLAQTLGVLMHREHPLADRVQVLLEELQPYALVHFQRHLSPGLYDEILELCRVRGYVPPKLLHTVTITTALVMNQHAVTFMPGWPLRSSRASGELVWKPLEDSPLHQWTSAVCRLNEWGGITRLAMNVIATALQEHDNWAPLPRPPVKRAAASRHLKAL